MLRREFGEWIPWLPPGGHPARAALVALHEMSLDRDYEEQRQALQAREGESVFVGSRLVPKDPAEGRVAVWTDGGGGRTWFPRAARVVLLRPADGDAYKQVADVRWDRFVEIMGASLRPLDVWLPRWEVKGFPDAATLERLVTASK